MTDYALSPDEQLALGGLLRTLIRMDGQYTPAENEALEDVLQEVLAEPQGFAFRSPDTSQTPQTSLVWELLGRAARELPDEDSVRRAALAVTRPEARETIYSAVFTVAAADTIVDPEWRLLEWLKEIWQIREDGTQTD
jgi:hypothetical protein